MQIRPIDPLKLNFNARYYSDYYSDDANTPAFKINSETIIDAKASYDFGQVSVFAFIRNASDRNYQVWQFRPRNASIGDPREYGFGLEARF